MNEVFIRTKDLPEWVADRFFKGKDIISIDELYWEFENLICDFDELEEKYNDFRQNVEENYKYSPQA